MSTRGQWKPQTVSIVVSGGTGSETLEQGGIVLAVGIQSPTSSSMYDLDISDSDGYGLMGRAKLRGNTTVKERFHADPDDTQIITISGANEDGTYTVRTWFDHYNSG